MGTLCKRLQQAVGVSSTPSGLSCYACYIETLGTVSLIPLAAAVSVEIVRCAHLQSNI